MNPLKFTFIIFLLSVSLIAQANIQCVKQAYPDHVRAVSNEVLTWQDGALMPMQDGKPNKMRQERLDKPALIEQLTSEVYKKGFSPNETLDPMGDPGRIRYEPFFKKMYGETQEQVESHLVIVYWMPHVFGYQYPLPVTTINGVNFQFESLSSDLEAWVHKHPEAVVYLANPGGTYNWRKIANTNRLSMHCFGMTIDLTPQLTEYWQTDLVRAGRIISEDEPLVYHNQVPLEIVSIFEAHGFIWGGKWHHYDTQHFEYRPELLC